MTTDKKIKIAFVYDAIYPYIKGGAERRYFEIGKRLVLNGYDVHLYGMKLWKGSVVIQNEGMTLHGICPAKKLYNNSGKRSIWQAIYFGLNCFKLLTEDFDIIDCCGFPYFSLFSCKIVCILKRKKLYSTWHEVWGKEYWREYVGIYSPIATYIEKASATMPDIIISVSKTTKKRIRNILGFKGNIFLSSNGIDITEINGVKSSRMKSDIIYAGRHMDFKHIDILLKAISLLNNDSRYIRCIIIGDGPEKKKLEKLTFQLNLQKNVKFLGFLPHHKDVYSYLKSSKVFVLPSTREGFGIAILEANACGLKAVTIASENNAASELINKHTGELSALDEIKLAKSINNMLISSGVKIVKKEVKEHYNWDIITKHMALHYI